MDDFNSETDSDYTSYWRDWVGLHECFLLFITFALNECDGRHVAAYLDDGKARWEDRKIRPLSRAGGPRKAAFAGL